MKHLILFIALVAGIAFYGNAQSPKMVIIEHFTNTLCSSCAAYNPGFYQTLSNYPEVLHIAYHPSAPYSGCFFSKQNKAENDARTVYYNIYGSTPRTVLNGKVLTPAAPMINNTTLDTALNKTSPVEVKVYQELLSSDSVKAKVVVKTTGVTSLSNVRLFAGVVEEPVNYSAGNGEKIHHDVFRKALTAVTGNQIMLPALNDSIEVEFTYTIKNDWVANNLYTLAYVQREDTKTGINAGKSSRGISTSAAFDENENIQFSILPNPVSEKLKLSNFSSGKKVNYSIFNLTGQKILEGSLSKNEIDVSLLPGGMYFFRLENEVRRFIKL